LAFSPKVLHHQFQSRILIIPKSVKTSRITRIQLIHQLQALDTVDKNLPREGSDQKITLKLHLLDVYFEADLAHNFIRHPVDNIHLGGGETGLVVFHEVITLVHGANHEKYCLEFLCELYILGLNVLFYGPFVTLGGHLVDSLAGTEDKEELNS
jgi:hypothetical protein